MPIEKITREEFVKRVGREPFSGIQPTNQTPETGGIFEPITKRADKLGAQVERIAGEDSRIGARDIPEVALNVLGQSIGAGYDIVFKGLSKVTPGFIKEPIKAGLQKVVATKPVSGALQKVGEFAEAHPRAATNIESAIGVASLIPAVKGAMAGKEVVKATAQEASTQFTKHQVKNIDNFITKSFEKGVRPTVAGKATAAQLKGSQAQARKAVFSILENKNNLKFATETGEEIAGKLPNSLQEFAEAIGQTKKSLFQKYDALTKQAGQSGAKVSARPIIRELRTVAKNKSIKTVAPDVADYADDWTRRLVVADKTGKAIKVKEFKPYEAQEMIEILNKNLDAFYRNPSYDNARKVTIDAMVANHLRKSLDQSIEKVTGPGYQAFKSRYGSLKSIEKDVVRRAVVDSRKNIKGLIDYSDIFSGGQVISGILTLNPTLVASGVTQKLIAGAIKRINDPNRIISNMFEKLDNVVTKARSKGIPTPGVGQ